MLRLFEKKTSDIVGQIAAQIHDELHEPELAMGCFHSQEGMVMLRRPRKQLLDG